MKRKELIGIVVVQLHDTTYDSSSEILHLRGVSAHAHALIEGGHCSPGEDNTVWPEILAGIIFGKMYDGF